MLLYKLTVEFRGTLWICHVAKEYFFINTFLLRSDTTRLNYHSALQTTSERLILLTTHPRRLLISTLLHFHSIFCYLTWLFSSYWQFYRQSLFFISPWIASFSLVSSPKSFPSRILWNTTGQLFWTFRSK